MVFTSRNLQVQFRGGGGGVPVLVFKLSVRGRSAGLYLFMEKLKLKKDTIQTHNFILKFIFQFYKYSESSNQCFMLCFI